MCSSQEKLLAFKPRVFLSFHTIISHYGFIWGYLCLFNMFMNSKRTKIPQGFGGLFPFLEYSKIVNMSLRTKILYAIETRVLVSFSHSFFFNLFFFNYWFS